MKKLIVLVLAAAFSVSANATYFMCRDYTDNKVNINAHDFESGLQSDAPIRSAVTNVRLNPDGFTVSQNGVFEQNLIFKSPRFKQMDRYASSPKGMIFRKTDGNGQPYFIVLTTPKPEKIGERPKDNPINRMVTLGNCTEH